MDSFDRLRLAQIWARSIHSHSSEECLVVGIEGDWGSGKTAFAEYLIGSLSELEPAPVVIRLDPWLFGSVEELIRQFFQHVRSRLKSANDTESIWKSAPKIDFDQILEGFSLLLSVGELSPVGSNYFQIGQRWIDRIRPALRLSKPAAGTLHDQKAELDKTFLGLDRRVIVLLDDLDRLEPKSAASMLQLVRMNASFPNFTYIIPYDSEMLGKSIDSAYNIKSGNSYVEKVITLPLTLPSPSRENLEKFFFDSIILPFSTSPPDHEESYSWSRLLDLVLGTEITTPRQIIRLKNLLIASFQDIQDEVTLMDFILIESIRLQHINIYRQIWEHPSLFIGQPDLLRSKSEDFPETKESLKLQKEAFRNSLDDSGCSEDIVTYLFLT